MMRPGDRSSYLVSLAREITYLRSSRWDLFLLLGLPALGFVVIAAMFLRGTIDNIPIAVVDEDHSALSRLVTRHVGADHTLYMTAMPADLAEASSLMRSGRILAIVHIPAGLEVAATRRDTSAISIFYNASLLTAGGQAATAAGAAAQAAVAEVTLARRDLGGLSEVHLTPPSIAVMIVGNGQRSFERFLEPLILAGVLHLLLSCAAVGAVGRELKLRTLPAWRAAVGGRMAAALAGKLTPYVMAYIGWYALMWVWLAGIRGWPVAGHVAALIGAQALLVMATAGIGALLVAVARDVDVAFSASTVYAGSAIAFSNGTLPVLHSNWFTESWSAVLPFTNYLRLQNQQFILGSDLASGWRFATVLALYALVGVLIAAPLLARLADRMPQEDTGPLGPAAGERRFWTAFVDTFVAVARHRALMSVLVLSVVLYGFYYPLAYSSQTGSQLPVAVVDLDQTPLSRDLQRALASTRAISIQTHPSSLAEARELLRNDQVDGIVLIESGLQRSLVRAGDNGGLAVMLSGAYLVRAQEIGNAFAASLMNAVSTLAAPLRALVRESLPSITVEQRPLFNVTGGYGSYAVPAVAAIITQQTLLFGAAMFVALRRERRRDPRMSPRAFAGTWLAFTLLGCFTSLFYFGFIFWLQDYPRGGNIPGLMVTIPVFAAAVSALGLTAGSLFERSDRPMQILAGTSVPLFFLGGAAWPLFAMPGPIAWLAHLAPSTAAMHGLIALNAAGASLAEIAPEFINLAALATLYGTLAAWRLVTLAPPQQETSHATA